MVICLSEDAYKAVIDSTVGDIFKNKFLCQIPNLTEEVLVKKMKGYKINRDDKKVRIVQSLLDENGIVRDLAVCTEITDTVVWDRG